MRFRFLPLIGPLLLGGCLSVPGSPLEMIGTIRDVQNAREGIQMMNAFWSARKQEIPTAGTYRLTYEFPGEAPLVLYVRTLKQANMPIMIDRNDARIGSGLWQSEKADLETAYMVNILGAETREGLLPSLDAFSKANPPEIQGFLVVTDSAGRDAQGGLRFLGSFWVAAADTLTGESARFHRLQSRTFAKLRAQETQPAARGKKAAAPEPRDAFEAIRTVLTLHADGRVTSTERYIIGNEVAFMLRAERIDTEAYVIGDENLRRPGVKETLESYRVGGGK